MMIAQKEIMSRVYIDAQKACGLKVGDYVKVLRKAEDCEAGWGCRWNSKYMDCLVGKVGKVEGIHENGMGIEVAIEKCSHRFPYFVLEKVDKPAPTFKPYDPVLVRDEDFNPWRPDIFLWYDSVLSKFPYVCAKNCCKLCIPYKGNEHLNGTTDNPEE